MLIYAAIQIDQLSDVFTSAVANVGLIYNPWNCNIHTITHSLDTVANRICALVIRPFLIAMPCVVALAGVLMAFVTYRLYQEFGWSIVCTLYPIKNWIIAQAVANFKTTV